MDNDIELLTEDNKKVTKKDKSKNKKKKKNSKIKSIIYSIILLVFFSLFLFIMLDKTNPVEEEIYKGDIGINYQRDILLKAKSNISNYNIDDGKSITIDAKKLVDNPRYKECSGTIEIIKNKDTYEYFPKVNCGDKNYKLQLKTIGELSADEIYGVDNDIVIASYENAKTENHKLISGDLFLSLYDNSGKLKWRSSPIVINSDKNVYLDVVDIKKIKNYYYVLCNKPVYLNAKKLEDCILYYLKYDLDGNLIDSSEITIDGHKIIAIDKYMGNNRNKENYYYRGYTKLDNDQHNTTCLIYLNEDGFHIFNENRLKELSKYFDLEFMVEDNYIYGLFYDDSRESITEKDDKKVYPLSVYKLDIDGNLITKKDFLVDKGKFNTEYATMITDNIYFLYGEENNSTKKHVVKYDKNLNFITEIDYNKYMINDNQRLFGYGVHGKSIFYHFSDNEGVYTSEVNYNDNYVKTHKLLTEDIFNNYYMLNGVFLDNKIVEAFADNYGSIILMFYNK